MGLKNSPTWIAGALFGAADVTHITTSWINGLVMHGFPQPVIDTVHMSGAAALWLLSTRLAWHCFGESARVLHAAARVIEAVHRVGEDAIGSVYGWFKARLVGSLGRLLRWLSET